MKPNKGLIKSYPMSLVRPKREVCTNSLQGAPDSAVLRESVDWVKSYSLRHNKSTASPGAICFFDTETWYDKNTAYQTGQFQRLRLGVAIAGRLEGGKWTREKRLYFKTSGEFWDFIMGLMDPKRPLWLFAHNIGFDLTTTQFPERLQDGTFTIHNPNKITKRRGADGKEREQTTGFLCTDDPPTIISCHDKLGRKLICVDTFNYFTTSLQKLGEMVGITKGNDLAENPDDERLRRYCENDVEIIKLSVLRFIDWVKTNDLGKFRFTVPSQAMAAFRHKWNKPAIQCHSNETIRGLERAAYYGGRLQCFYIGEVRGMVYELDVTSLYPSVMKGELYPYRLIEFYHPATHSKRKETTLGLDCVAEVKLHTQTGFPKRQKGLGTIYPVGDYWTTLAGPELQMALEMGLVREYRGWARYELREIFTGFVDFFWQYRLEQKQLGNEINANLAKLIMNSLYGKFGQQTPAWEDRLDLKPSGKLSIYIDETNADGGSTIFRGIGNQVQQFKGKGEHPNAFPAIAAYVTAYARRWMHNLMLVAGNSNVYYIVTDGLFTNEVGKRNLEASNLICDNQLGMLRIKHAAETGKFAAIHHYEIGIHSVNGSRKKSARVNPDGSVTEVHFESFEKILQRKPDGSVHVQPVTKTFSKEYKRGTRLDTGWITPLVLNED